MSPLHAEILPAAQLNSLRLLSAAVSQEGFYLGGDTALALHLGHRRSVDLDWFRGDSIADPLALAERLSRAGICFGVSSTSKDTLQGSVDGVQVSFFAYRYPCLRPPLIWPELGCHLAALEDLACMKLAAAAQRGSRKDLVDLFFLFKAGIRLEQMLAWFKEKYAMENIGHLLAALCYFDDAEREPMPTMLAPGTWEEMQAALADAVRRYAG